MGSKLSKLIVFLGIVGMGLSAYLWYLHLRDIAPVCATNGCGIVAASKYAVLLGVPVAALGFFFYGTLTALGFERLFIRDIIIERLFLIDLITGIIFSIYLRFLEFFKIGAICIWCWGSVLIIVLITAVYWIERNAEKRKEAS